MDYIVTIWLRPFTRYVVRDVDSEEEAWEALNQDDFDDISMLLEEGGSARGQVDIFPVPNLEMQHRKQYEDKLGDIED